jgi:pilus assembly protein CpaB
MRFVLMLGGALLLGGAAALIYFVSYTGPVQQPTVPVADAAPAPPPPPRRLAVLAAARAMPFGTLLRREDLQWVDLSEGADTSGLFVRGVVPDDELYGSALRADVAEGQPIGTPMVVRPGDRAFLASVLTPGMRAVSINLATGSSVGGLVQPGDRVDILLLQAFAQEPALSPRRAASETILTNVRIIAIDQRLLPTPIRPSEDAPGAVRGGPPPSDPRAQRNITVEASPEDSERLLLANELGRLDLALRSNETRPETERQRPTWADQASAALNSSNRQGQRAVVEVPSTLTVYRGNKIERLDLNAGAAR